MSIGYACLALGVPETKIGAVIKKNASEKKLLELTEANLEALENLIEYNIRSGIRLFRISSDLIPFGSSPVNKLPWWEIFKERLEQIGARALAAGMRLSMHPGQYTVLNSPRLEVVENAVLDLAYHARVLDGLGAGPEHKIILHLGGVYNERQEALRRFKNNCKQLDHKIKRRLIIENDERLYNIETVLEAGRALEIPVVFDNLHHRINPPQVVRSEREWVRLCRETWADSDGPQKIHYSQQAIGKRPGAHTDTIYIQEFMAFYDALGQDKPDIMLEVKDKNLSAVKCINCTRPEKGIKALEREWSFYKYRVLESSQSIYCEIRELLKDKDAYPAVEFYSLIEAALQREINPGEAVNAALHVWGYFKDRATEEERKSFAKSLAGFQAGTVSLKALKRRLYRLAKKYDRPYLLSSYYFVL